MVPESSLKSIGYLMAVMNIEIVTLNSTGKRFQRFLVERVSLLTTPAPRILKLDNQVAFSIKE